LKVLVACEYSGVVRDAFIRKGHDAISCDILPSDSDFGPHYQGDVMDVLRKEWDLVIAHPPCTYLTNSGVRWLYKDDGNYDLERWHNMRAGANFFRTLLDCNAGKVAVENPVMHGFAKEIVGEGATQYIQPWQFGHGEVKRTGLWLRNLPKLVPTDVVEGRTPRVHHASPGPLRWKERSTTLLGIGNAMADQWG
jgi:hypothetical protein